ncbi:NADPH:quinone oxidoreductase family protein [Allohahella sp. A8]|uniref:NADPH:quinone oxidoreductase family protein n=1 Tax=Allohahella sp. A8 TaxID=3141461 RepID=UPI000C090D61|nr:NADPH:quinone oxidoreductase [Hahellaceae bacterium]|tara:strand:- start:5878 stop:6864 length:987 start_codon:yes stop_codon:yes gene_type:complete
MKAVLCKTLGPASNLVVEETADPKLNPKGVLIEVAAAGLNFPDTLIIEGNYQFKPTLPFSPGGEISGRVLEVGEQVKGFKAGDRVMALTGWGGFAEKVVVGAANIVPTPESLDDLTAAGFMMTYGTSMHALKQRADVQAGERVLVLGAGGGVGLAAVEIAKAMGAYVIAAASSDEKLEAAKTAGADQFINYGRDDFKDALKAISKNDPIDVVYDPVGGDKTETALRSLGWNGRHLVIGFASGDIAKVPANLTLLKGCQLVGVFWGAFAQKFPEENFANFKQLGVWLNDGQLKPKVNEIYDFADAPKAIDNMAQRKLVGKAVVRVTAKA